jgi:hypothetical protein
MWFDKKGLAAYLSRKPRTITNDIKDPLKPLPCRRVRGKLLFNKDEVDQWVASFERGGGEVEQLVEQVFRDLGTRQNTRKKSPTPHRR